MEYQVIQHPHRPLSSSLSRVSPKINRPLLRIAGNLSQLCIRELEFPNRIERVVKLLNISSSDKRRGDASVTQHPRNCHLRQRLPAPTRNFVQRPHTFEI